jgi:hypothetical protein
MAEGIETKKEGNYESYVTPGDLAADFLADPQMHAHHHLMNLKDHDRFEIDLEALQEENVDLLLRIEKLELTVKKLDSIINWDNVVDIVDKLEGDIPFA